MKVCHIIDRNSLYLCARTNSLVYFASKANNVVTLFLLTVQRNDKFCDIYQNKNKQPNILQLHLPHIDVLFIMKLDVLPFNEDVEKSKYFLVLFILSVSFVTVRICINVTHLHMEISRRCDNSILRLTGISKLITSNSICGSLSGAESLCNLYLFFSSMFTIGLPQHHKNIETNVASIVLFEIIVYLDIQMAALTPELCSNTADLGALVALASKVFTITAIFLKVFEPLFSNKTLKAENILMVLLNVGFKLLGSMSEGRCLFSVVYE